jgi:hypothetical protein
VNKRILLLVTFMTEVGPTGRLLSVAAHGLAAADHTASVTLNLRASWSIGTS